MGVALAQTAHLGFKDHYLVIDLLDSVGHRCLLIKNQRNSSYKHFLLITPIHKTSARIPFDTRETCSLVGNSNKK